MTDKLNKTIGVTIGPRLWGRVPSP